MGISKCDILSLILVLFNAVQLEGVTVNPNLCPTNKIAPHRRVESWNQPRTFGAFYDLLAPNNHNEQFDASNNNNVQFDPSHELQEKPQEDDPDDCGEIEDYDENDLSSITPQYQRRHGFRQKRILFGGPPRWPSQYIPVGAPMQPPATYRPQRPIKPPSPSYQPTRPPYWSGGLFGTNGYRPPLPQYPSDNIKPVHENGNNEAQVTYRPDLVGGSLGHVVGVSPVRPTYPEPTSVMTPQFQNVRFPTTTPASTYQTRRPRPRNINNNGIFRSFVDLLLRK